MSKKNLYKKTLFYLKSVIKNFIYIYIYIYNALKKSSSRGVRFKECPLEL